MNYKERLLQQLKFNRWDYPFVLVFLPLSWAILKYGSGLLKIIGILPIVIFFMVVIQFIQNEKEIKKLKEGKNESNKS